jgi:NitT/TauT family transport system substrate-binding protein
MSFTRRSILAAATLALVGATAFTSAHAQPADMLELKLALGTADVNFNPTTASVYRLADTLGFYEKHGVKVEIVALDGTPQAVAALNSGAVDIADISIDAAVRLRADNDVAIKGFTSVALGNPFLIAAKTDITSVEELVGRSYAVADNGSLDYNLSRAVIDSFGVDVDGPDFVAIGAPDIRVQALAVGRVDATTVSFGTYQSIAGTEGVHVLVDADEFAKRSPGQSKFVAALEPTLEDKSEAIQRFTNALADASRTMQQDPQIWIDALTAAREDLKPEAIQSTAEINARRWCVNGCMNPESLDKSVAYAYSTADFAEVKEIPASDVYTTSFADQMMETLGKAEGNILDAR